MDQLQIKYLNVDELTPYNKNARKHTQEDVYYIENSIKEFGMIDPIGIWSDQNIVVEGHGRLLACKNLGIKEVPTIRLDHLTDEQRRAYAIAHNKTAEMSEWDIEMLDFELNDIDFDMTMFGFEDEEEEEKIEVVDDYYEPEVPEEPKAKPGYVYQLGEHRLMCGDSTKLSDVEKLLDGEHVDLVVTDPPYNVNIGETNRAKVKMGLNHYKGANTDSIANDHMENDEFLEFITSAFLCMKEALRPGGSYYIWYACTSALEFLKGLENNDLRIHQQIIWNKDRITLGFSDYQWKHEPCLYGWKEGAAHYFTSDRTNASVYSDNPIDLESMNKEQMKELLSEILSDFTKTTVIDEKKPLKADLHPTMKPVPLIGKLIQNSSRPEDKVLDLFGGSGTTLIASEQLGRQCYIMEYDPKYADVIIERWEKFTGKEAVLVCRNS